MAIHKDIAEGGRHPPVDRVFANAATRIAYTGYVAGDVGKWYQDDDTGNVFELTAVTPTFRQVASSGFDPTIEDAVTAAVTDVLALSHNSTGTPAAGFGTGLAFKGETTTTEDTDMGSLAFEWKVATDGAQHAQAVIRGFYIANEHVLGVLVPPTSAAVAGNARGAGAVELMAGRGGATEVAGGTYSTIVGGRGNTVSGNYGAVLGGAYNEVSDAYGVVTGGQSNVASGVYSSVGGGIENEAAGAYGSVMGGSGNYAGGAYSAIPGGLQASADKHGQISHAAGQFDNTGDAQHTSMVVRSSETHGDATWRELFTDGSAARMTIGTDRAWTFNILVVGMSAGAAKTFSFRIEGAIENDGGTTTLKASTVTTIDDADDTSFDARVTADDTNDALLVEVSDSDGAGDVVRWVASVDVVEVQFS